MNGGPTGRWSASILGGAVLLCVCTALLTWWIVRKPNEAVRTAGPLALQDAHSANDVPEALTTIEESPQPRSDAIQAGVSSVETHDADQQSASPKPHGIEIIVRDLRHDLGKLRELKLYGTGDRIVQWATFLREDLLGNSYLMDESIPKGFLDRHESYTAVKGPNGGRVYSFTREDYPLFYEMMQRQPQHYEAVLEDDLIERIANFAQDAITLSGVPPK